MILALVVLCAFLVETAAGFGSMVVALTLGSIWFPLDTLLGWLVPLNLVLSTYLVVRGWSAVDWRLLFRRIVPLMVAGMVAGLIVAGALRAAVLQVIFGVFVVGVAAWQLVSLRGEAVTRPLSRPVRVTALLGAGLAHGIFATGGPLAVFVAARELTEKRSFRATLAALWVLLNVVMVAQLAVRGVVSPATLPVSGLLLVPLALGIGAGEWVHRSLDERRFKLAVAALLIVAGGVLTVTSLRGAGA